ncbi:MAG: DMT family transporter [Candidatus Nanoarchaeia archaeon]|nr:DMT family transporter [Candidatus Nanoarchaeia archaeon]MDD5740633.1 DMT family transporter [Candidatus Nanoarchaeia archaeon]
MIIEVSVLFAFVAMFCWAFGDFFIQKCTRKIGDIESLAYIGVIGAIILLPLIVKDFHLLTSLPNLLLLLFLGVVTFISALFDFEALKKGKLSVVDIIIELELPVTIVLGFIFFRETLSVLQITAICFVLFGLFLMATKSFSHWRTKIERGAIIALIAAVTMGFVNFLTASSSRQISPLMAIWVPWLIFTIMCLVYICKKEGTLRFLKNGMKFKGIVLAMGIFDTLAWLFYAFATLNNEIAIVTAITECYPAITILLGVYINKEKIGWHQYLGGAVALIASISLAFFI